MQIKGQVIAVDPRRYIADGLCDVYGIALKVYDLWGFDTIYMEFSPTLVRRLWRTPKLEGKYLKVQARFNAKVTQAGKAVYSNCIPPIITDFKLINPKE